MTAQNEGEEAHNNAIKKDAVDSAAVAHGYAILCATTTPLLRLLLRR